MNKRYIIIIIYCLLIIACMGCNAKNSSGISVDCNHPAHSIINSWLPPEMDFRFEGYEASVYAENITLRYVTDPLYQTLSKDEYNRLKKIGENKVIPTEDAEAGDYQKIGECKDAISFELCLPLRDSYEDQADNSQYTKDKWLILKLHKDDEIRGLIIVRWHCTDSAGTDWEFEKCLVEEYEKAISEEKCDRKIKEVMGK